MPIVFFSRCRPQDADPIELVRRFRHLFIGWPAWRPGSVYVPGALRTSIVDVTCPDDIWAWEMARQPSKERRHYNQNRNFVKKVTPLSIALVPRPNLGVVFAGRVLGPFMLLDDPPWAEDYLRLRGDQRVWIGDEPGRSHLGDVAQCWEVDEFRPIPVPAIPAWIRRSLFGRSTYGRVIPPTEGFDPVVEMEALLEDPRRPQYPWTSDVAEIERQLVTDVGPSTFEHLCVALLQLERPDETWIHVGGSGDGGVDGIGAHEMGTVTRILQCKWAYYGEPLNFVAPWGRSEQDTTARIVAALVHPNGGPRDEEIEFLSRTAVAQLVLKHAKQLPLAITLRVGSAQTRALPPVSG